MSLAFPTRWGLCALALALPMAPSLAQDLQLARNLAATCANCHGTNGKAKGDMKPLAGMPADKLLALWADYKSGAQPATIMHQISKGYTDEQVRLIAAYFASQSPAKP
ncbi:c-type cytochrome [Inhella crocodyli]|uniref:C-type cytochrome n=1 Tax=Inhella crocodyli TaxID=2499851 RepID=A0A437LQW5_9BURK|nr:c-type cytochrome [Inhella crocodyli]RVT87816.1 c-type cytochrome [Inhella crocodyli]